MPRNLAVKGACVFCIGLSGASSVFAQDRNLQIMSSDVAEANVIIVTANKREEALLDVPLSIAAFSGDRLSDIGATDVGDLVKLVPGLGVARSNTGAPIITLRGIGFNADYIAASPTVSLYLDEIPFAFPAISRGATLDVARVEVLKGPQGILFGQNATGGAINYIAAEPTADFQAGMDVEFGRFSHLDVESFVSGPISETVSGRLAVRTEQGGPWQESYTQDLELGRPDFTTFRATLNWEPSSNFNAQMRFSGFVDKSENQAGQLITIDPAANFDLLNQFLPELVNYPESPRTPRAADWTPGQDLRRNNEMYQGSLRLDYTASDALTLTSLTSYSKFTEDSFAEYDGVSLITNQVETDNELKAFNQEIRATGSLMGDRLQFLIGANFDRTTVEEISDVSTEESTGAYAIGALVPGDLPLLSGAIVYGRQKFETWSLFGNVDYEIVPNVTLRAGARYTNSKIDFAGCTRSGEDGAYGILSTALANFVRSLSNLPPIAPIQPGECGTFTPSFEPELFQGSLDEDNLSWRAILDWKPSPDTLVYASVTRGYKAGSFPAISTTQSVQFVPAVQEQVTAYEAGIKTNIMDKFQINAAGFYYDYKDKQVLNAVIVPVFGQLSALVNIPKSRVAGGELELTYRPTRTLTLSAAGTYVSSRIGDFTGFTQRGDITDHTGRPFPFTPKFSAIASIDYKAPLNDNWDVFAGANLSYQDSTYASIEPDENFNIDSYALLDLRAGIESGDGRYRISVWGRNVTNEYYWTSVTTALDTLTRFTGMPATYGISLGFRFR